MSRKWTILATVIRPRARAPCCCGLLCRFVLKRIKGRISFILCTVIPFDSTNLVEGVLRLLELPEALLSFLCACKVEGGFYSWFGEKGEKLRKGHWVLHMTAVLRGGARSCDHCRTCSRCGEMGKGCWRRHDRSRRRRGWGK